MDTTLVFSRFEFLGKENLILLLGSKVNLKPNCEKILKIFERDRIIKKAKQQD